jgi:ABC-2 type transport system ATP-binding protein
MNTVAEVDGLTRHFGRVAALDGVSFALRPNTIYGLLGRNGAGKSTLMQILAGHLPASSGRVTVLGDSPYEHDKVRAQVCLIRENQTYPDQFRVHHALRGASYLFPGWDEAYAESLVDDFRLPRSRRAKKLPYIGLDAAARQLFYDRLLADYAERPRTIVLSTHLIDEVADLVEHVLLLDRGRLLVDDDAEHLRGQVVSVAGPATAVNRLTAGRTELHRTTVGTLTRATVHGLDEAARGTATELGLTLEPLSLQHAIVSLTTNAMEDSR